MRTRKALLNSKIKNKYIIPNLRGKLNHFLNIEKEWGIYVPFNKGDLERYKE